MKRIDTLSSIGYGTYRLRITEKEHYASLNYALDFGCNLIDTAPTYGNGQAERLIGEVLRERINDSVFIVNKAGYMNPYVLGQLSKARLDPSHFEVVEIGKEECHSIHPDFIKFQMDCSEVRLGRSADGFLLHNPEYHLSHNDEESSAKYVQKLKNAFTFLEEQVKIGRITYYGVSSNELPSGTNLGKVTGLQQMISIVEEIASNHHFKLIQFPFNYFENLASQKGIHGKSLIQLAREGAIVTLSNRPLNSNHNNNSLRLATYTLDNEEINEVKGKEVVDRFINLVGDHLRSIGVHDDVFEYIPVQVLDTNWNFFEHTDTVDFFFDRHLTPFLHKAFDGAFSEHFNRVLGELYSVLCVHARRRMNESSMAMVHFMHIEKHETNHDQSLSNLAVNYCLKNGIDHVLAGMRSRKYVDDLKNLFHYDTASLDAFA